MPLTEEEKQGVIDLLVDDKQNLPILFQVAKSVSRNVVDITSKEEAIELLETHITDASTLLNKRHITKEILFKYLHRKKVPITDVFTKNTLVNQVISYWKSSIGQNLSETNTNFHQRLSTDVHSALNTESDEVDYPIHLLARQFSKWFFDNYNKKELKAVDFWADTKLKLRIQANDRTDETECIGSSEVIGVLYTTTQQFGFFFNVNLSHCGVQGRMNEHGLVLALACGTLHTEVNCVGVFESIFGLLRDPFAENNWKIKTMQFMLRSQGADHTPSLKDSDTLREALELSVPTGDL